MPPGVDILLVEDNANDAELTLRALKQRNLANQVFLCRDGAEALDFFSNGASPVPKVVLLDLKLPRWTVSKSCGGSRRKRARRAFPSWS